MILVIAVMTSVFAALAIMKVDRRWPSHGKDGWVRAIAALPGSGKRLNVWLPATDGFIWAAIAETKMHSLSIAAHLYEKSNPYVLPGPGGALDLHDCTFTPVMTIK